MDAIEFHSQQATKWESGYRSSVFSVRLRVLDSLIPEDLVGQLWLDAGCGTGTVARWLADRGANVIAVDASAEMLRNAAAHPRVEYRLEDVTDMRLKDNTFDGIVSSSVIEYLDKPMVALLEFNRVLHSRGVLAVSAPHSALAVRIPMRLIYWLTRPRGKRRSFRFLDHSRHAWSGKSLAATLELCGFVPKQIVPFGRLDLLGIRLSSTPSLLMAIANK
jgi:2-polyprenyl-6-hydroxyphenyl methylase/3-demethylubiquinone-9 3-methyltransferase